jgi:hypothetical protein
VQKRVVALCGNTVRYGLFRGLQLVRDTQWGVGLDRASMLLGFYEQEVLASLAALDAERRIFMDIGAADGYYAVGALVSGRFDRAVCFESSADSRYVIARNAELNGVQDRLTVMGEATPGFAECLSSDERRRAVVLMDIEGGEFALLDARALATLRDTVVIVELHDWLVPDGAQGLARLRALASETHDITEFRMSSRDPSRIPELWAFDDTDRWLLCAEGRPVLMSWLRLDPKSPT